MIKVNKTTEKTDEYIRIGDIWGFSMGDTGFALVDSNGEHLMVFFKPDIQEIYTLTDYDLTYQCNLWDAIKNMNLCEPNEIEKIFYNSNDFTLTLDY